MPVFHGDKHDEDPEEFLSWFHQCTKTGDDPDAFKARMFVNYLQVYSEADEWFEDLPEEEKKSWSNIERLFRRKWLKEEEISTKETANIENKPQSTPTPSQSITPDSHHETDTKNNNQDTPEGDVEHVEPQDATVTSPPIITTSSAITATTSPQLVPPPPNTPTTPLITPSTCPAPKTNPNDEKTPKLPNTSPNPPQSPPNEQISPQPPPDTSKTPLNTSTTLETPLTIIGFTQKQPKTPVFDQKHAETRKSLVLDENTMYFRSITTNGSPSNPTTYGDEEISPIELPFSPTHDPSHLPVATSLLRAPINYVSSAQTDSTFENPTTDVMSEPTTPIITTYKPHTPTTNPPTPENATKTAEFNQKPPKPPENTPILIILWHPEIVASDAPTSGKDPPHLAKSFYLLHTTYIQKKKIRTFSTHFDTAFIFFLCFLLLLTYLLYIFLHIWIPDLVLFHFFVFFFVLFPGDEDAAMFEGGHME
jgi:hypothetical protein